MTKTQITELLANSDSHSFRIEVGNINTYPTPGGAPASEGLRVAFYLDTRTENGTVTRTLSESHQVTGTASEVLEKLTELGLGEFYE